MNFTGDSSSPVRGWRAGEVHGGERAVVDAQGEPVAVEDFEDVEDVEDVLVAAHEAEHLGDVHRVARPRAGEQFAELGPMERVEAAECPRVFLEEDRVLDIGLGEDEVLAAGGLLVGRHPLVDEIGHAVSPLLPPHRTLGVIYPCRLPLSSSAIGSHGIGAAVGPQNHRVQSRKR
ncbi:hypothetical protein [Kitasatospora sp. NPDC088134]|uniref:hypothetical protein n=1 Tax=Kitasatospora sp. NPDC088134 TaxID=3364071 RepID=UPI003825D8D8